MEWRFDLVSMSDDERQNVPESYWLVTWNGYVPMLCSPSTVIEK